MPVLPPIDESTCAKRVVGTCTKSIPLIYEEATYPAKSPITPPPIAIISDFLVRPAFIACSSIFWKVSRHLDSSPAGTIYSLTNLAPKESINLFNCVLYTFSSEITSTIS